MTINKKQIKTILDDLYAIDKNLRAYENELQNLIFAILENAPQTEFDENFRIELRGRLMAEAQRLKQSQPVYEKQFSIWGLFTKKFAYAGVLGAILILVAAGWFANKQGVLNLKPTPEPQSLSFQKTELKDNAFGSLFNQPDGQATAQDSAALGFGRGGGGGVAASPVAPPSGQATTKESADIAIGRGGGGGNGFSEPGMPFIMPEYKFVYKGGDFDLPGDSVEVLRRKTGFEGILGLEGMLDRLGMGLADLNSFGALKVQNMNLTNETDLGYSVNIDFLSGMIGISEYWPYWEPAIQSDQRQLTLSDLPSEQEIITIANNFLRDHAISTQNYGQPEIEEVLLRILKGEEIAGSASMPYISDIVQVNYPLLVNNMEVYDTGANKYGLFVSVNIRLKKATGVWNLTAQNYDASNYSAETDRSRIITAAENGGIWGQGYFSEGANVTELELGAPKLVYGIIWNYQKGISGQLLVPSLMFPIVKIPENNPYFYQKNVVIPLAKEFFDQNKDILVPLPMPLETKPVESQVAPDTR